jgi:hypothetical protein
MFKCLESTDFVEVINEKANEMIQKDRDRFSEIYETVKDFCRVNKIIISDIGSILGNKSSSDYKFELYCDNPYKHAVHLTNQIHSHVGEWVKMSTIVSQQEFVINYDMRPLITVYGLYKPANVDLFSLILPIDENHLLFMSPEVEIIDIYHKLYSPDQASDWSDLVKTESSLFKLLKSRIDNGVFGGRQERSSGPKDQTNLQYIKFLVLSEFCSEFIKNYVVVGYWALNVIADENEIKSSREKLQMITSMNIKKSIEDIMSFLKRHVNAKVSYRKQNLHIPKDFRINRYTVYITLPGSSKEKAFIDIFNCGNFELIPYIPITVTGGAKGGYRKKKRNFSQKKNKNDKNPRNNKNNKQPSTFAIEKDFVVKVGNPYVLLRFFIIDLWIMRMIFEMKHFTSEILKLKTKQLMYAVDQIKSPDFPIGGEVFGLDYVGIYQNYNNSKKINNLKGKMFYPYYPERDMQKNNQYKIIN